MPVRSFLLGYFEHSHLPMSMWKLGPHGRQLDRCRLSPRTECPRNECLRVAIRRRWPRPVSVCSDLQHLNLPAHTIETQRHPELYGYRVRMGHSEVFLLLRCHPLAPAIPRGSDSFLGRAVRICTSATVSNKEIQPKPQGPHVTRRP